MPNIRSTIGHELHDKLKDEAKRQRRTQAQLIRQAIADYLDACDEGNKYADKTVQWCGRKHENTEEGAEPDSEPGHYKGR